MYEIMSNYEAYRIASRVYTSLHYTERDALDRSDRYQEILDAVKAEDVTTALEGLQSVRTEAGNAWRAKRGYNFAGNDADKATRL